MDSFPQGITTGAGVATRPARVRPEPHRRRRRQSRRVMIAEVLVGLIAAAGVVLFGGVQGHVHALMQAGAAVAGIVLFWRLDRRHLSFSLLALTAAVLAIPLLQRVSLPPVLLGSLGSARLALDAHLDGLAGAAAGGSWLSVSIDRHATWIGFLKWVSYAIAFLAGWLALRVNRRTVLPAALVIIAGFEAVYGIIQYLANWPYIFGYHHFLNAGSATGTYINRNNYAGLLEMALPFVLAHVLFRSLPPLGSGARRWKKLLASQASGRLIGVVVVFGVLFLALVFSMSRMGIIAGFAGLTLVFAVAAFGEQRRAAPVVASVCLSLGLAYAVWVGVEPVLKRFEALTSQANPEAIRVQVWKDSARVLRETPWFGTGLGTYGTAIHHWQSALFHLEYEHAHNDYLEFASELGIPLALLLFGGIGLLLARLIRRIGALEPGRDRALAAGCAGAIAALLVHSLTEFNLQIPANALLFAWICGVGAGIAARAREKAVPIVLAPEPVDASGTTEGERARSFREDRAHSTRMPVIARAALVLALAVGAAFALIEARNALRIPRMEMAGGNPPFWAGANPNFWKRSGRLVLGSLQDPQSPEAAEYFIRAARLNPLDPDAWDGLSSAYLRAGDFPKAERSLRAGLVAMPDSSSFAWRLANTLLISGKVPEALGLLRTAASDPRMRLAAFDLGWKIAPEPEAVLRDLVPEAGRADYLRYLILRARLEEAYPVWSMVRRQEPPADASRLGYQYLNVIVREAQAGLANRVWKDLLEDARLPNARPEGELITNGDFELDLPDGGLAWRLLRGTGYRISFDTTQAKSGIRSLLVSFDGTTNPHFTAVNQAVPVEPNRAYRLTAYIRTENITSDLGPRLWLYPWKAPQGEMVAIHTPNRTGTTLWTAEELEFKTGPNTHFVIVGLLRQQSRKLNNLLGGKVWLDGVSLRALSDR